jgi:hypothetical protein
LEFDDFNNSLDSKPKTTQIKSPRFKCISNKLFTKQPKKVKNKLEMEKGILEHEYKIFKNQFEKSLYKENLAEIN